MQTFDRETLAGAGPFQCEDCGYAVALRERDDPPACPACGGTRFERASMFTSEETVTELPHGPVERPDWLAAARAALVADGHYLAYESDGRVHVVPLQDGWTRIGRSLAAHVRLDDPTVSRRHALVYRDDDGAKVLDDRSLNGVFRNGEQVDLSELTDGDVLDIGRFALHVLALSSDRPA